MAILPVLISIVLLGCYCEEDEAAATTIEGPDDAIMRTQMMSAALVLSNTFHQRFHKNQKVVLYAETEVDENYILNPLEITCVISMVMSGMSEDKGIQEMKHFLGYRRVQFNYQDIFQVMQKYLYSEEYKVSSKWARKIFLSTDIFTNRDFQLLESFKEKAGAMFRSEIHDLSKHGEETKKKVIEDVVSNRTNGFVAPTQRRNTDFDAMMIATTYIEDFWLYPMEQVNHPVQITCTIENKEFKLRTSTRVISTWYVDESDRFGIIIPFKRAAMSFFFYVPKTEDLFINLNEEMNYDYMKKMLDAMLLKELVRIKVTFPLIEMSYSRNLTYDMEVLGVTSLFIIDSIRYKNMTEATNLVVSEVYHNSSIRMTENGVHFASITDLIVKKGSGSLENEDAFVLQDLLRKTTETETFRDLEIEEDSNFLHKRLNNNSTTGIKQYRKETTGRKEISSKTPSLTTKTNPIIHIADILKGKLSSASKKRNRRQLKLFMSKKCKKLPTARSKKSYKAIPTPPYFEDTSTVPLNSNAVYYDFLDKTQLTTESLESCLNVESSPCTNGKIRYYTPLTSAGTKVYETEKSIPALLGYDSKSDHRQNKALWPEGTTKWGFFRPRFTWTGPRTSTQRYTFTQESILSVTIKNSFFYALINQNTGIIFALGKVSHCKA